MCDTWAALIERNASTHPSSLKLPKTPNISLADCQIAGPPKRVGSRPESLSLRLLSLHSPSAVPSMGSQGEAKELQKKAGP